MKHVHALLSIFAMSVLMLSPVHAKDMSREVVKQHKLSEIATTKIHPKVEDWEDPMICGGCHERQYKGWMGSMHSISFKDPIFQAEWAIAEKETGGQMLELCGGCHTPIGVLTNTVKFDPSLGKHGGFTAEGVAEQGVSCDVCHTAVGSTHATSPYGSPGNNSLVFSPGNVKYGPIKDAKSPYHETEYSEMHTKAEQGVSCDVCHTAVGSTHATSPYGSPGNNSLVFSPGNVKYGPIKDAKSPYHETEYSEMHTKAEFCGNCHNIFHPTNKFPIEHTYDEWKMTPYAQAGIVCQDCHMVPVETAMRVADEMTRPKDLKDHGLGGYAGMGAEQERSLVHDHGFVGGNAVIAPLLGVEGGEEHKAEAIKRLQSVASLDMNVRPLDKNGTYELKVKVTNERAGHQMPTSLTFMRQIWLEIVVKDQAGNVIMTSGQPDAKNNLPEGTVIFRNRSVDADGKDTIDPWKIAGFTEMNTIPPKGHRYGTYAFNTLGKFTVDAKLHYRSYPQKAADKLLGKGVVTVPAIEMVSMQRSFDQHGQMLAEDSNPEKVARAD